MNVTTETVEATELKTVNARDVVVQLVICSCAEQLKMGDTYSDCKLRLKSIFNFLFLL